MSLTLILRHESVHNNSGRPYKIRSPKRRDLESAAADSTKSYWNTPPFPVPHHDILKPDVMLATRRTAINADHQADFDVGETVEQVSRDGSGGRYAVLAVGKAILCFPILPRV
ncbi:hypothetical protein V2G26_007350 [Clonostachys chloroleuca]